MRDRSMRSGTELAREIKLTDWSMAGNLSNRSSGVQIPRDICTRLKRYLYSAKCSWIISMGYWPSLFGQDGWILAKSFFCVFILFFHLFFHFFNFILFYLSTTYNTKQLPVLLTILQFTSPTLRINVITSFFACLWTETKSRSTNSQKKNEANI